MKINASLIWTRTVISLSPAASLSTQMMRTISNSDNWNTTSLRLLTGLNLRGIALFHSVFISKLYLTPAQSGCPASMWYRKSLLVAQCLHYYQWHCLLLCWVASIVIAGLCRVGRNLHQAILNSHYTTLETRRPSLPADTLMLRLLVSLQDNAERLKIRQVNSLLLV